MKRPIGLNIIAGGLTVIGGFTSVLVFLAVLDSMRLNGIASILVYSPSSLLGFLLYGALPVLFYSTGLGLFQFRPWARKSVLVLIPLISFGWIWNISYKMTYEEVITEHSVLLVKGGPEMFLGLFSLYFLLFIPIFLYFSRPSVRILFVE